MAVFVMWTIQQRRVRMDMNTLNARDLADRLESAANTQRKTERNKIFMEITYPAANDAIRSLRELSAIVEKAMMIIGDNANPEFDHLIEQAKARNILKP
jgi:hypothetical protein